MHFTNKYIEKDLALSYQVKKKNAKKLKFEKLEMLKLKSWLQQLITIKGGERYLS